MGLLADTNGWSHGLLHSWLRMLAAKHARKGDSALAADLKHDVHDEQESTQQQVLVNVMCKCLHKCI